MARAGPSIGHIEQTESYFNYLLHQPGMRGTRARQIHRQVRSTRLLPLPLQQTPKSNFGDEEDSYAIRVFRNEISIESTANVQIACAYQGLRDDGLQLSRLEIDMAIQQTEKMFPDMIDDLVLGLDRTSHHGEDSDEEGEDMAIELRDGRSGQGVIASTIDLEDLDAERISIDEADNEWQLEGFDGVNDGDNEVLSNLLGNVQAQASLL